jgi:amino acid permease
LAKLERLMDPGRLGSTASLLLGALLGTGSLTLPWAFARAGGLVPGLLLVLAGALHSFAALKFLLLVSQLTNKLSYFDIAARCFGTGFARFTQLCLLLSLFFSTGVRSIFPHGTDYHHACLHTQFHSSSSSATWRRLCSSRHWATRRASSPAGTPLR